MMRVMFRVKTSLLLLVTGLFSTVGGLSAKPPQPALGTPVGLKTTAGNSWVSLTWSPSAGATSYHLKRATKSGGPYVQIAAPVSTFHTDSGLAVGTTYFYVISAVNSAGESANSTEVSVRLAASTAAQVPSTPIGLTATPGNSWVSLTWPEVPGAASYRLKRATGTGGPYVQIAAPVSTGHTDSGLENGRTYFYVVSAEGTVGESSNSAQVGATPSGEAALSNSTARLATAAGTLGLPATFFGQTITWVGASHFPSVPFGSFRLWDTQTTWAEIETSRNTFTWSELDAWLAVAAGEDKDVLYTFGRTPQWISMRPSESCTHGNIGCAAPPSDVDSGDASFKAFVTAVVKHSLASSTGHIKYYEVWNEPNNSQYWSGTPAQLATMATDAYAIIHSLDPNALVVGPPPTGSNTVPWLASYYAAGALHAQDIVALHSYITDGPALAARVDDLRSMMSSNGIGDEPIWSTEGGFGNLSLTTAQRVAAVGQMYTMLWSRDVGRFYWFAWDSSNNWGTMWTSDGGVNSSGVAYGVLYSWLVGSTHSPNPCSEASDSTWTCTLTLSTGYPAEIVWNSTTSKTLAVSSAFATYETLANTTAHSIANHQVAIGNEPILIIKSQAQ
jgi:hypothetical protein